MDIPFIVQAIQIVSAIGIIIAVLLQRSEAGVGSAFGGSDMAETGSTKRRGSEKIVFVGTIILACIFVLSMVLPLFIA